MATFNVSNFEFELIKKIRNTTDDKELAILHKALNVLKTGAIFTVIQFSDLPDASNNLGKLYFVKNDSILYFSIISVNNIEYWVPITSGLEINTLWSWGRNNYGVLGNGYVSARSCPGTTVGCGTNWRQVSGLACHTSAIKTDGTLWTWGLNTYGRLGDGTTVTRCSPGTVAGGGTNWCRVSAGGQNTAAIKTDGTLWTWGYNNVGRLGDGTTIARSSPGTVAGGGINWCQVSLGSAHTAAIKTDGTLWTWGVNNFGQLGDGTTIIRSSPVTVVGGGTNWCFVSAGGDNFTAAIKNDGTLWTWGRNTCGGLGDGTAVDKSCPGTVAGGGTNWCWVSGFACHMGAIKCDGTLWTWGRNACILGDGTTTCRSSPGTTAGCGTNWCQISVGCCHVAAIKTDGTIWTWGCNLAGSLGDGTTFQRNSPGTIAGGGTTWCQVSASGYNFTAAIQRETL